MKEEIKKGEIIIYKSPDNKINVNVSLKNETVWLDAHKIAQIFDVNRPAIVKHINNIYNLDMIISVGYRVNSKRATQFRVWATNTLKNYLVKGYAINEKRLLEAQNKFNELQNAVDFLRQKSKYELLAGQEQEIFSRATSDVAKFMSICDS